MSVLQITKANFEELVKKSEKPVRFSLFLYFISQIKVAIYHPVQYRCCKESRPFLTYTVCTALR